MNAQTKEGRSAPEEEVSPRSLDELKAALAEAKDGEAYAQEERKRLMNEFHDADCHWETCLRLCKDLQDKIFEAEGRLGRREEEAA